MNASFSIVPAAQLEPAELHAAFSLAFSDYLAGAFEVPLERFGALLARQAVAIEHSRAAVDASGAVLAFALVAPRPDAMRWRLSTMGAVPAARGSGAAAALLDDFIERAAAERMAGVELECFEQNTRALRLYSGRGFTIRHRLWAFERRLGAAPAAAAAPQPVGRDAALDWLVAAAGRCAELPLQVTAPVLAALDEEWTAWQHGSAQLVFRRLDAERTIVRSLVDLDPVQRGAAALLQALLAAFGGTRIEVPALQRDDVGGDALRRAGFVVQPLNQVWMLRPG